MDMAIHPGRAYCRRISPYVTVIAVREVQHEEVCPLFDPADPDQGFAEVGLRMARRMRQRREYFLTTTFQIANIP